MTIKERDPFVKTLIHSPKTAFSGERTWTPVNLPEIGEEPFVINLGRGKRIALDKTPVGHERAQYQVRHKSSNGSLSWNTKKLEWGNDINDPRAPWAKKIRWEQNPYRGPWGNDQ